jgi:lauroyl/myristoyl acyltransferase
MEKCKIFLMLACIRMIQSFPWVILRYLARFLSTILAIILKREKNIAYTQINYALPGLAPHQIFRSSLESALLTGFEGFRIKEILGNPVPDEMNNIKPVSGQVNAFGLEDLYPVINDRKGAVCLTGHLGNFELMAAFFSLQGFPMTVIARKANNPAFQKIITEIREGYGLEILWRENPETSKLLMRAIRNNRYICALIDQDTALENAFCPFFNLEAAHPVSPVKIAVRFKKPVLFCSIRRNNNHSHELHISRIHWEKIPEDSIEQFILDEYSKRMEHEISQNPSQWVWWHRRWRRRPGIDYTQEPEKLLSTKAYIRWLETQKSHTGE